MKYYAIGHELGAVRTIYTSKNVCPEIRIYDTANDMYADICPGKVCITALDDDLYIAYDEHAKDKGEPCTYQIIVNTAHGTVPVGFYGNVVIVGYDPAINAFISLTDKQVDVILSRRKEMCPTCRMKERLMFNRRPIKILFRKPDEDPELMEIRNVEEVSKLLNSNHLIYTDIGDGMFAISREHADRNGEEVNVYHSYNDGTQDHIDKICGDVFF